MRMYTKKDAISYRKHPLSIVSFLVARNRRADAMVNARGNATCWD